MTHAALAAALLTGPVTADRAQKALRHLPAQSSIDQVLAVMHPPSVMEAWRMMFVTIGALADTRADATGIP